MCIPRRYSYPRPYPLCRAVPPSSAHSSTAAFTSPSPPSAPHPGDRQHRVVRRDRRGDSIQNLRVGPRFSTQLGGDAGGAAAATAAGGGGGGRRGRPGLPIPDFGRPRLAASAILSGIRETAVRQRAGPIAAEFPSGSVRPRVQSTGSSWMERAGSVVRSGSMSDMFHSNGPEVTPRCLQCSVSG